MAWGYDRRRDMLTGYDFPGACGAGMHQFQLDELELGARVALAIDDPDADQWWWALVVEPMLATERLAADLPPLPPEAMPL